MAAARRRPAVIVAGMLVGVFGGALARRMRGADGRPDPAREAFLDERRERIRVAHVELVAPPSPDRA